MKKIIGLVLVGFVVFIGYVASMLPSAGAPQEFSIDQPAVSIMPVDGQVMAGAVSVDITPPPGIPKGGYSTLGNDGVGFRTRLKARIFYLSDGQGESTALIQTDMAGSSLLLQHKVAAAVAEKTGISPRGIVITGTHSHSSFGSHFSNDFYNKHFSNKPGIEPELVEMLTQQISTGVIQAYEQRRPAIIATGKKDIYGYNRNRMLNSYAMNENHKDIDINDPETKFKEVNPSMYMLRIDALDDDGKYKPLGAFSSFSIHGTALTVPTRVYNGDLFAYAQRELEWKIQDQYQPSWEVLHGITTGTQGDMAPALEEADPHFADGAVDFIAAKKLGVGIGKEAIALFDSLESKLTDSLVLASAAREINIRKNNVVEGIEICEQPFIGNTTAGGAYERRSRGISAIPLVRGGGWGSKRTSDTEGCHGHKRILGTATLQSLLEPADSFPNTVLFQIIRINDLAIMPLPFEMTSESGRRVVARVQAEFSSAGQEIKYGMVTSVANGYFGYSTTPEEYSFQGYEGGSTLYGKNSTPYITAQLGVLARDFNEQGSILELADEWSYELGAASFLPKVKEATGQRQALVAPKFVQTQSAHEESYMFFRWDDVDLGLMDFHRAIGSVQVKSGDEWKTLKVGNHEINDEGYDIEIRYVAEKDKGMGEYEFRWYNPLAKGEYRFVIAARLESQSELYSESFTL